QVHHAGRTDTGRLRAGADSLRQVPRQGGVGVAHRRPVSLRVQQTEGSGRLVDVPQQAAKEGLVLLALHPETRASDEVAEGRRRRQLLAASAGERVDLVKQELEGRVI